MEVVAGVKLLEIKTRLGIDKQAIAICVRKYQKCLRLVCRDFKGDSAQLFQSTKPHASNPVHRKSSVPESCELSNVGQGKEDPL